jgi:hypothetical protein
MDGKDDGGKRRLVTADRINGQVLSQQWQGMFGAVRFELLATNLQQESSCPALAEL